MADRLADLLATRQCLEHFTLACTCGPACGFAWLRRTASTMQSIACFVLLATLVLGDVPQGYIRL